ncbi:MAG: hypothetical protein CMN55_14250 [Sneathiella sp.]|nr:hypothetical protein [Sneathiella sp.]|tara:strand:- start:232 stop:411 length:180 start_codon:yes stop_codon:yes gene_type:complete
MRVMRPFRPARAWLWAASAGASAGQKSRAHPRLLIYKAAAALYDPAAEPRKMNKNTGRS